MPLSDLRHEKFQCSYYLLAQQGWPAISIDDLADFYVLLVQRIISDDPPADGFDGYYFPIAHDIDWWEVMDAFSQALYSRGLVDQPKSVPATSTEEATARLGFPVTLASILFKSKYVLFLFHPFPKS